MGGGGGTTKPLTEYPCSTQSTIEKQNLTLTHNANRIIGRSTGIHSDDLSFYRRNNRKIEVGFGWPKGEVPRVEVSAPTCKLGERLGKCHNIKNVPFLYFVNSCIPQVTTGTPPPHKIRKIHRRGNFCTLQRLRKFYAN